MYKQILVTLPANMWRERKIILQPNDPWQYYHKTSAIRVLSHQCRLWVRFWVLVVPQTMVASVKRLLPPGSRCVQLGPKSQTFCHLPCSRKTGQEYLCPSNSFVLFSGGRPVDAIQCSNSHHMKNLTGQKKHLWNRYIKMTGREATPLETSPVVRQRCPPLQLCLRQAWIMLYLKPCQLQEQHWGHSAKRKVEA